MGLTGSLANPLFWFLHFFTHHSAFKMTQIMNRHWWGNFYRIVRAIYQQCLTCQFHNPRKTIFVLRSLRTPSSGPFECLQLDFIQLPLSLGCQYVLVIVCMFYRLTEAFPCHKADTFTMTKKLLENVFPTLGMPSTISSDGDTLFTERII